MSNETWLIILGAVVGAIFSTAAGLVAYFVQSRIERKDELKSIKIALLDELEEIKTTLTNMRLVWDQAQTISPTLTNDLLSNTRAYAELRLRLFLIKDDKLRRKIAAFYKKMSDACKKHEGQIGTLDKSEEAMKKQKEAEGEFEKLQVDVEDVIKDIT